MFDCNVKQMSDIEDQRSPSLDALKLCIPTKIGINLSKGENMAVSNLRVIT